MNPPQSIPDWLLDRLYAASQAPPRYEASLYGPMDSILATYFPPQQRFMVKPQGKVRPGYEYDVGDVRKSFDSYNEPVQPRGEGEEADVKIPDFIVVKGTATLTDDVPLLVVEIQRDDLDEATSIVQLGEYMGAFADKFGNFKFKGALVQSSKVLLYEWPTTAPFVPKLKKTSVITDVTFLKWVRNIAMDNWEVDAA